MTVNVDELTSKRFRRLAGIKYGKRKGYLGRALSEAMKTWLARQENEDIDVQAIEELRKGYNFGGLKYKNRGDLHKRKPFL